MVIRIAKCCRKADRPSDVQDRGVVTKMRLPGLKSARRLRAEFGFLLAEFRRHRLAKIVSLE